MISRKTITALLAFLAIFFLPVIADVSLPAVISDNMVLQQQTEVTAWGWADPGEKVVIKGSWRWSSKASAVTNADGKWSAKLKTPKAGGPYKLTIKGDNVVVLNNILIGEVWVCSGQSNMQMGLVRNDPWTKGVFNYQSEVASANYPNIRLFTVEGKFAAEPQKDCVGKWSVCSPKTIPNFSAVAYFFARKIHKETGLPIGLINASWGGTPAEAWTSAEALKKHADFLLVIEQIQKPLGIDNQNSPTALYNGMIAPIIPFGIKGVIWYQGESNANRWYQYRSLFPLMIKNWRTDWERNDFPFYYVQIAPFNYGPENISAKLREAQFMTLSVPNTGMAVTMDIGNINDIHPRNKQLVGRRLALWALAKDYGHAELVYSGPIYSSMTIEGKKIRLSFDHVGSGLMAKGGDLSHFTIAGNDRQFVAASAEIDNNTIVVTSEKVKNPVAVRYAWKNTDVPNLYNLDGLPASSFRTDNWE